MRNFLFCIALALSFVLPSGFAMAQPEVVEICPEGDVECLSRVLDDRLRIVIENLPDAILAAPMPKARLIATIPVLAGAGNSGEKDIPVAQCGKGMNLSVTGQAGAIGYMMCGVALIQCQVPVNGNNCTAQGRVGAQAAGKCGVAATNAAPAMATCQSVN